MPPLQQNLSRLIGATLPDGRVVDVQMKDDVVTAVSPSTGAAAGDGELDLTGYLLLTAPAEPHAHLDKALSWDEISPPMGDLGLAIDSWRAHSSTMTTEGIAARATAALRMMLQAGTTAVRTHVDLLPGPQPLRGVEALTGLREQVGHLVDLQIVAMAGPSTPDATVHAALDLGADLIGGAPHLAPDPLHDLDRLLSIAVERGVGADLHTDENLHREPTLRHYANSVRDWPADRVRSAGHCVRQGTQSAGDLVPVIEAVLAAGIGVISLPITNLYLQGWEHPASTPRGLTALRAFLDAGVLVAGGADNLRDPFNPVGRGDALETASLLVTAGHLTLVEAYHAVSAGARAVLGLPPAGAEPGLVADFLAVPGAGLGEVIAAAPAQRRVIHRGALVASSSVVHHSAF